MRYILAAAVVLFTSEGAAQQRTSDAVQEVMVMIVSELPVPGPDVESVILQRDGEPRILLRSDRADLRLLLAAIRTVQVALSEDLLTAEAVLRVERRNVPRTWRRLDGRASRFLEKLRREPIKDTPGVGQAQSRRLVITVNRVEGSDD